MKRILKRMLLFIGAVIVIMVIAIFSFVHWSPQFGQPPIGQDKERLKKSTHYDYDKGEFVNLIKTEMGSFSEMMSTLPDFLFGKGGAPKEPLPTAFKEEQEESNDSLCYITWYGHSAFLIEIDNKRILIDPMLGSVAAPVSFGSKRFAYEQDIPLSSLTDIDAVIISHDHYDHLDYPTIKKLAPETGHFYTALGVGSHLKSWGIAEEDITELDWWEASSLGDISLTACPARHFSGRGLTDRNATQWASWVIETPRSKVFFSGDGGYGPHFKEIGDRLGPFDIGLMECGQYNKAWEAIHMLPEQSVQAGVDVKAKKIMPIHWGAFKLAVHEWTDPIERFTAAGEKLNMPVVHPLIGERFELKTKRAFKNWWKLPS